MGKSDLTRLTGPDIERRPEVGELLAALRNLGIDLDGPAKQISLTPPRSTK